MSLEKAHAEQGKSLSYCELNLETWRQLWRVLEISDIVLIIADARYPVRNSIIFLFHTHFYPYIFRRVSCSLHRYSNT